MVAYGDWHGDLSFGLGVCYGLRRILIINNDFSWEFVSGGFVQRMGLQLTPLSSFLVGSSGYVDGQSIVPIAIINWEYICRTLMTTGML